MRGLDSLTRVELVPFVMLVYHCPPALDDGITTMETSAWLQAETYIVECWRDRSVWPDR